jgi:hypothetical protein
MKKLPNYAKVNEMFEGWSAPVKEKARLVAVRWARQGKQSAGRGVACCALGEVP